MVKVLFEDNHLLLVNKPAGIATQPTPTSPDSLELLCKNWLKNKYQKPGNVYLHAIHRLDKPVSGMVLFAKTSKALSRLNSSMRAHELQKVYIARVQGRLKLENGTLEHYLLHGDHIAHVTQASVTGAKRACLSYCVKEFRSADSTSLIEVTLETGRYHQIRVQMSAIGHPVVGDVKYGSSQKFTKDTIALCHARFSFPHPITHERLSFTIDENFS